jgi:hypothetical protein
MVRFTRFRWAAYRSKSIGSPDAVGSKTKLLQQLRRWWVIHWWLGETHRLGDRTAREFVQGDGFASTQFLETRLLRSYLFVFLINPDTPGWKPARRNRLEARAAARPGSPLEPTGWKPVLRHGLKVRAFAFRAGRGDLGGHRTGEMFQVAAGGAAPAQAADFFPGAQARNDDVEPVADLLECFPERF